MRASASSRLGASIFCVWIWLQAVALGHIGNPNTVFEGKAGGYPVRVIVQAPPVVPGLATIFVRVLDGRPQRVEVLPIHWRTGREGAPSADPALPVEGEESLYQASLWFMVQGAYSVDVRVVGEQGDGTLQVPVNSAATTTLAMPRYLGAILAVLGSGLMLLLVSIARAASRESMLPSGAEVTPASRLHGNIATAVAALIAGALVWAGARWWDVEEAAHRRFALFRPTQSRIDFHPGLEPAANVLKFELLQDPSRGDAPIIPDHGRLLHLFLIRDQPTPVLVHLHPDRDPKGVFRSEIPTLPEGEYQVYADITRETGFQETITNRLSIAAADRSHGLGRLNQGDDSLGEVSALSMGPEMSLSEGRKVRIGGLDGVRADEPVAIRFEFIEANGQRSQLQSYMGMLGHAVVVDAAGMVFSHVHPSGTASMAAQRQFLKRDARDVDQALRDANCGDLTVLPASAVADLGRGGTVSFPYAFPKAGRYHVWIQARIEGRIRTGGFEVNVGESRRRAWNPYRE